MPAFCAVVSPVAGGCTVYCAAKTMPVAVEMASGVFAPGDSEDGIVGGEGVIDSWEAQAVTPPRGVG